MALIPLVEETKMNKFVDVSVVIVNWNSWGVLRDCLNSFFGTSDGLSYEVIVVDNASSDSSCAYIVRDYPTVKLIRNEHNFGFAAANNQGIRETLGRYVLLLNPDTIVHSGAIVECIQFADNENRCGVLGCRTLEADGSLQHNCFLPPGFLNLAISTFGLHRVFPRSKIFGRERMTYWQLDDCRKVSNVAGCFMLARSEAIAEVGLLDEKFFMYAEEMDWCQRFRDAGWEVWYTPNATITHLGGISSAQNMEGMKTEGIRSLIYYINKHCGKAEGILCRLLLALTQVSRTLVKVFRPQNGDRAIRTLTQTILRLRIIFSID
jgi:GT2 family glycosyltransferase